MTVAVVRSRALAGIHAPEVTVEVHLGNGLPAFSVVGLPETEVKEARERVRAAIQVAAFDFPNRRVTVNLAPADLPKDSSRFDLPIALGVLVASGQLPADRLDRYEFAGELSLTGVLRPVRGALAMSVFARGCGRAFVLPECDAYEAALVSGARVYGAADLRAASRMLLHPEVIDQTDPSMPRLAAPSVAIESNTPDSLDLSDVLGQSVAKRALIVAAAGAHSLLLIGPPGVGKSMLAQRLPGLLPPLSETQALEAAAVASLSGRFDISRWRQRPMRAPHHSASAAALIGGGNPPRPGEISLAHHGVLFLDELAEFNRYALEALREPLETGHVTISRAARQAKFPARFQLIAAMNPCLCGYHGTPRCRCTPDQIQRYQSRVSGPLLDRIDMQWRLAAEPTAKLGAESAPPRAQQVDDCSAHARGLVAAARARQLTRQGVLNNALSARQLDQFAPLARDAAQLLAQASDMFGWSLRARHRAHRVARTIADLAERGEVQSSDVAEAIQFRRSL